MGPSRVEPDPADSEQFIGAIKGELSKGPPFLCCSPAFTLRPEMAYLALLRWRGAKAGCDNLGST